MFPGSGRHGPVQPDGRAHPLEYIGPPGVHLKTVMTKSTIFLIVVLIAMAGAYTYWFTDWFRPGTIQILAQVRPSRATEPGPPGIVKTYPVSFAFDRDVRLTEIKVVSADEEKTNKYPHVLWHQISDSNSLPVRAIYYGQWLRGMKSAVPHARPDMLQPDVKYRLYIIAGRLTGKRDFSTVAVPEQ